MKTTLRQLDKALEALATSHVQVADYFFGDWADSFEGRVQRYPAVVCNVQPVITFTKVTSLIINVICVDQITGAPDQLREVESDTLQILHDFYKVLRYSPNWQALGAVQQAGTNLKFKDRSPDEVAGWQMPISIKLKEGVGLCDLPFEDYDFNKKLNC